ncbi:jg6022 [Pararge aegeria aegeria]|uniref:Jg6022 protein n=1 Tax=Pararge aegeria aegeria TaxID=348720 RepID=A0A8S4QAX2_9NEOP|nr:jg6022 [Pararge aegeria aegeria]
MPAPCESCKDTCGSGTAACGAGCTCGPSCACGDGKPSGNVILSFNTIAIIINSINPSPAQYRARVSSNNESLLIL